MYAVIDIGSNTIRLVVYRLEGGAIRPMLNNKYAAGLAGYLDENRCLQPEGIARAVAVLCEFRRVAELLPDCEILPFATASLRNIENRDEVLACIRRDCGMAVRVLTGEEEALMDYRGAIRSLHCDGGLLADIGGGSTELVFHRGGAVAAAYSLPLGSLSLYNRFVEEILPTGKELKKMEREIRAQLQKIPLPPGDFSPCPLLGVGGTARGALELWRGLDGGEGISYDCAFFGRVLDLLGRNPKKLVNRILKAAPDRIHTLLPGILILKLIGETYGSATVLTSDYGVREGYLYHVLEGRGELHG